MELEKSTSTISVSDNKSHRENVQYLSESSDYESESSDYESESSDSSDCEEFLDNMRKSAGPISTNLPTLTTKGELTMEDLPAVENLQITVKPTDLVELGEVLHPITNDDTKTYLVVVKSKANINPLDVDSVLFLSPDNPLGKIFEVIGSVIEPVYTVRFNNAEEISNKGVSKSSTNQSVYYSVSDGELTRYVLVDVLKQQKGSDASWKDNNEPPPEEIDYSDDEQEKLAKQKRRAKTRGNERNWNDGGEAEGAAPNKMERTDATYRQSRIFKRASTNQFRSPTPDPSRSSPHPFSPRNFRQPPISSVSPQPFGLTASNSVPLVQRNVPSPQSFGPFLQRNVPSPQPSGPFAHTNVPPSQSFGALPHSNIPPPQSFGALPHSNVPSPQPFGPLSPSSVPSHQHFIVPSTSYVVAPPTLALPHAAGGPQLNPPNFMVASQNNVPFQQQPSSSGLSRNVVSPQSFELASSNSNPFLQRNVPPPQLFGQFPQNNVRSPQLFGQFSQNNVQSPQLFGHFPQNNVQSPQQFGPPPNRNIPSPQLFGPPPQRNIQSPQPMGAFPHSNAPSPQPLGLFPQASGSSFQHNPSSIMAAPQITIPLQQQILLQPHQPGTSFLSQPPPNYISHQNSRPGYHRP